MSDANRPEPRPRLVRDWLLIAAASVAPLLWLGQLILGYFISAGACYPGENPVRIATTGQLHATIVTVDIVAILAALTAGAYNASAYVRHAQARSAAGDATRFLALWGSLSSLIFVAAIAFTTVASLGAPLCG